MSEISSEGCRADVWLWRARFFKTRTAAAAYVDEGRIRQTRSGRETRLDKASRPIKIGDELVFAIAGRLHALRVDSLGVRRGPPEEARKLYTASKTLANSD